MNVLRRKVFVCLLAIGFCVEVLASGSGASLPSPDEALGNAAAGSRNYRSPGQDQLLHSDQLYHQISSAPGRPKQATGGHFRKQVAASANEFPLEQKESKFTDGFDEFND